ncbi:MAG: hypothetical protein R3349_02845 [Geminicoccaceae bacterium]|nr:hypothetical protein [Geminicoccaceae bacterium]
MPQPDAVADAPIQAADASPQTVGRRRDRPAAPEPASHQVGKGAASGGPALAADAPADATRRIQEELAGLVRDQLADTAETTRRLVACRSIPAAMSIQVEAAVRTLGRLAGHGQAMTALGRDVVRSLTAHRRREP